MNNILDLSNRGYDEENFIADLPPDINVLNLSNNNFNILPEIPDNIQVLDLRNNINLNTLTNIPNNLKQMFIDNTQIQFTSSQKKYIKLKKIQIINLQKLINNAGYSLNLKKLNLSSLDYTLPQDISVIEADYNKFTTLFTLPTNINQLYMRNNLLTSVNLSNYKNLQHIDFERNNITDIVFDNSTDVLYNEVNLSNNKLKKLYINNCEILIAEFNNIEDFSINYNFIRSLNLRNNNLSTLNLQKMVNLTILNCGYNNLSDINLQDCINLKKLYINNNKLQNINLNNNKKLEDLFLQDNNLSNINLSENIFIEHLNLSENKLHNFDISHLNKLHTCEINYNSLESLILPQNCVILYCNNNSLENLNIPDSLQGCELNNNKFTEFKNLNNLQKLDLSFNNIRYFELLTPNDNLTHFDLSNNYILNINLQNFNLLKFCLLNDNDINNFPEINNNLLFLNLNNNYIKNIPNLISTNLQELSLYNNHIQSIEYNSLPSSLIYLNIQNNYLIKCISSTQNIQIDCNLYDNYIDTLDEDYKQNNTFGDVIIEYLQPTENDTTPTNDTTKKIKTSKIKCVNPTTFIGDDVNNSNIDIIILNTLNSNKYTTYCYNYMEFFMGTKNNKVYEYDENNNAILDKMVFKEPYTGLFFNDKSYEFAKIYNSFIIKKYKTTKIGTNELNVISRIHGSTENIYELVPIKFSDLMLCLDRKNKITPTQMILKDIELQDLNIHFRNLQIQEKNNTKFIEYNSVNLFIAIYWNNESKSDYISYNKNKRYGKRFNTTF